MRDKTSIITLIAIFIIMISLSIAVEENAFDLKKIREDHRYDSFGFAIFLAGSVRLASVLGRLCLLKTSKSKKSGN